MANESELIRSCATLYVSFALESFFTVIMGIIFSYLLLLITNKGRLQKPGAAMGKMVWKTIKGFWGEIYREVSKWPDMKAAPIEARLALCRKANQGICAFTVLVAALTLTRWAHFNNVNGFRYLGYCITCPPKQAELVLLIAPTVPCYRVVVVFTVVVTAAMLITGYGASVISGDLYNGNLADFLETGDWEALQPTAKMYWLIPSSILLLWLSLIQIPVLMLWYKIKGGEAAGLPHGYIKLCLIVALTWLAFPLWWLISFEGASLLKDTKLNAIGFSFLNVISKGSFTLHMLSVSAWHRNKKRREEAIAMGRRPSIPSVSIFADHHEPGEAAHEDLETVKSSPKLVRQETTIITLLRSYDDAPKDGDVAWASLEPTQRAYFLGIGITPASYKAMGPEKRKDLLDNYAGIFDIMVDDKADENTIVSLQPTEPPSRLTSVGGHTALEPMGDLGIPSRPVVGQKVTTADGVTGRVMKISADEVQLALPGGAKQAARVEDLLKVVVGLTCIEGPEIAAWARGRAPGVGKVYCTCGVEGKHGSTARTPLCHVRGDTVRMNGHLDIFGFEAHDTLTFTIFGHDEAEPKDVILAEAKLPGSAFQEDGFENILPLTLGGQASESKIGLMVFVFGQQQPAAAGQGQG